MTTTTTVNTAPDQPSWATERTFIEEGDLIHDWRPLEHGTITGGITQYHHTDTVDGVKSDTVDVLARWGDGAPYDVEEFSLPVEHIPAVIAYLQNALNIIGGAK